ncbi:MAG TPA: DUF2782 domain-containing protein [Janthinobacterium sp.]|jgi:hypothetical protein|nr:DUF2782 domain-containing protein [Janthinobacterium sp.]
MMPTFKLWPALVLSLMAAAASAQTIQPAKPNQAPPKLEPIEEGSDTPITVTAQPSNEAKVSEHREQGVVKEIKVTSGPSTYYIRPNQPSGTSMPGDATNSGVHAPQWKVMEFDLGGKKKKTTTDDDAADDTPPRAQ